MAEPNAASGAPPLGAFWMPFTANRDFKSSPRLLVRAEGMHYWSDDGRRILDGTAGLWCVNAGHARREVTEAVAAQVARLDFAPTFQMGHPLPFALAERLAALAPGDLDHVFYANSGSEAVDTALKIALAYHRARGEGTRTRLIGRERAYHGTGFGGISVGGMVNNRRAFAPLLPGVDHLPHTLDLSRNAFSRGLPAHGIEAADALERIIALHDASNVAAVIVEPVSGSAGVLLPPAGYLARLREICDRHGVLLIFDEVITGFGRLGTPFAAQYFDVLPDLLVTAKAITNAAIPMGAVFARRHVHEAFMQGPASAIEFFHGYTYSGHPVACAAALATLDVHEREGLAARAALLAPVWEEAVHGLTGLPHVIDVRNLGLVAGIELAPRPGAPGARGHDVLRACFAAGLLVRASGDVIALSPPLIIERGEIDTLQSILGDVLARLH